MPAFDSAGTHVSKRAHCALKAPIMISQDDARQESQRTPYDLCSRVWPRGCDPVEHARFHLFRNVLRVRLKADLTTLRRWERLLQLALPTTAPHFICGLSRSEQREGEMGILVSRKAAGHLAAVAGCLNQADTDPFNFDNIAKQRNLNDKGKALAKALGDAIRWVGVPPARWAAPSGLAGIGNKNSR